MSFREKQVQEGYQIIHIYVNPQSYQSYQKYLYTKPSDFVWPDFELYAIYL